MATLPFTPKDGVRFWSKVEKTATCWNWKARQTNDGYGQFWLSGHMTRPHRIAYQMTRGPIPDGLHIDHICFNRLCVNPDHLRPATPKQNQEHRTMAKNNKSGVRGVYWRKDRNKWAATVMHNGTQVFYKLFENLHDAEAAVITKRNELFTHNDLDRKAS